LPNGTAPRDIRPARFAGTADIGVTVEPRRHLGLTLPARHSRRIASEGRNGERSTAIRFVMR
jgi:hypothetical protein